MNTWSCVLSWGVPWVAQLLFVLLFLHCTLLNRIDFHTIFHFTIVPSVRPALSNAINFTPNWTSALSFFVCYRMPNQRSLWNESQAKKNKIIENSAKDEDVRTVQQRCRGRCRRTPFHSKSSRIWFVNICNMLLVDIASHRAVTGCAYNLTNLPVCCNYLFQQRLSTTTVMVERGGRYLICTFVFRRGLSMYVGDWYLSNQLFVSREMRQLSVQVNLLL